MSALRVLPGSAPRESDSGAGLARVGACPFGARASAEAEGGNRARECPRQDWSRRNPVRRGGHHAPVAPLPTPRRPPSRTGRSRATAWDGVRLSAANRDRLLLKTPSPGPPFGTGPENPRIQTIPAFRVRAARSRPHHRLIQCGAQPPQFFHSHRPTHGISDTPSRSAEHASIPDSPPRWEMWNSTLEGVRRTGTPRCSGICWGELHAVAAELHAVAGSVGGDSTLERVLGFPTRASRKAAVRVSRPSGRGADQRSALQAVPALLLGWRYAVSSPCGRRCRCEHRRSRATPD